MNITSSSINFERGELAATARMYFARVHGDWGNGQNNLLREAELEFKRVLGNITQDHSVVNRYDDEQLLVLSKLITISVEGYKPQD